MSACCLTVYAKSPGLAMVPGKNRAIHARGATALCNCFVDKLLELKLSCGGGRKSRAYSLIFRRARSFHSDALLHGASSVRMTGVERCGSWESKSLGIICSAPLAFRR